MTMHWLFESPHSQYSCLYSRFCDIFKNLVFSGHISKHHKPVYGLAPGTRLPTGYRHDCPRPLGRGTTAGTAGV
ncbi:hypothetical protein DSECCO2_46800 [anaerobic digester metagenome]